MKFSLKYFWIFLLPFAYLSSEKKGAEPVKTVGNYFQVLLPVCAGGQTLIRRDWTGTKEFAESFGTTMAVTYILKPMINEQRPQRSRRSNRNPDRGGMSFPSGHSAAAFGGAAFLQMRYGWYWGAPAYLLAGYVGFSRIYGEKHWFMDVLGAAAIAVSANVLFTTRYCKRKIYIEPILEEERRGISLQWEL